MKECCEKGIVTELRTWKRGLKENEKCKVCEQPVIKPKKNKTAEFVRRKDDGTYSVVDV